MPNRWLSSAGVSILVLLLSGSGAGCGGTPRTGNSNGRMAKPTIRVESPVLKPGNRISSADSCRPGRIWVPLEWGPMPPGVAEIAVSISFNEIVRKSGGAVESTLASEMVVGGLAPSVRRLDVGHLPTGAFITDHTAGGYCPPPGQESGVVFAVYGLPGGHRLHKFEAIGLPTIEGLTRSAIAWGSLPAVYRG